MPMRQCTHRLEVGCAQSGRSPASSDSGTVIKVGKALQVLGIQAIVRINLE